MQLFKPGYPFSRFRFVAVVVGLAFFAPQIARAGVISDKIDLLTKTAKTGDWDVYLTGYCRHLPWEYTAAKRSRLNENIWGGGFGRSTVNQRGDKTSLYFLGFSDSHYQPQVITGYMWNRYWKITGDLEASLGYSIFVFSRQDVANYLPIPGALPCASLRFGRAELIGVYTPQISGLVQGEILFLYTRFKL